MQLFNEDLQQKPTGYFAQTGALSGRATVEVRTEMTGLEEFKVSDRERAAPAAPRLGLPASSSDTSRDRLT